MALSSTAAADCSIVTIDDAVTVACCRSPSRPACTLSTALFSALSALSLSSTAVTIVFMVLPTSAEAAATPSMALSDVDTARASVSTELAMLRIVDDKRSVLCRLRSRAAVCVTEKRRISSTKALLRWFSATAASRAWVSAVAICCSSALVTCRRAIVSSTRATAPMRDRS